jgi:hypothetical protein
MSIWTRPRRWLASSELASGVCISVPRAAALRRAKRPSIKSWREGRCERAASAGARTQVLAALARARVRLGGKQVDATTGRVFDQYPA